MLQENTRDQPFSLIVVSDSQSSHDMKGNENIKVVNLLTCRRGYAEAESTVSKL